MLRSICSVFMGMPRRMEHYDSRNAPYLIVAAAGAMLILFGLVFMIVQFVISVVRRSELRDWTGDPWDGLTLEWLTASPPAPYNFAVIPQVQSRRDAFLAMKERGTAYARPARYEDIAIPKNGAFGAVTGGLAFVFGFAMVWHMWWLAILGVLLIALTLIVRSSDDDTEYLLTASEVEKIETRRLQEMARTPRPDAAQDASAMPSASNAGASIVGETTLIFSARCGDRSSFPSLPLARKGLADATITFEGAGAGAPARSVASNIWSSLPSIGARPTNSTLTRAVPFL